MNIYMKRWREKNRDKLSANQRRYYSRHRSEIAVRDRKRKAKFYLANKDRVLARNKEWRLAHRDHFQTLLNGYRVRKIGASGRHTFLEWVTLKRKYAFRCAYCGKRKPLTRDHVIPLSRGGSDDIANVVPACRSCNSRKHAKLLGREGGGPR